MLKNVVKLSIAAHKNDFKNALTSLIHHLVDGVCFRERHLGILQKINHLVNVNWPWQWWLPILALISISYIKLSFKTLLLFLMKKNWQKTKPKPCFGHWLKSLQNTVLKIKCSTSFCLWNRKSFKVMKPCLTKTTSAYKKSALPSCVFVEKVLNNILNDQGGWLFWEIWRHQNFILRLTDL